MRSVIHKKVIVLDPDSPFKDNFFDVPEDAELLSVDWDTRDLYGIAFWYKTLSLPKDLLGGETKRWSFIIRYTGESFLESCTHLATIVKNGLAVHILADDGANVVWAGSGSQNLHAS